MNSSISSNLTDVTMETNFSEVDLENSEEIVPYIASILDFRNVMSGNFIPLTHSWDQLNIIRKSEDQEAVDINANRLTEIISQTIKTIKTISVLPILRQDNSALLYIYFKRAEAKYIEAVLEKTSQHRVIPVPKRHELMKSFEADRNKVFTPNLDAMKNIEFIKVLHLLKSNPRLQKCLDKLVEGKMYVWVQDLMNELDKFNETIARTAYVTAKTERNSIQIAKNNYIILKEKHNTIRALEDELNKQKLKHNKGLARVNAEIYSIKSKLRILDKTRRDSFNGRLARSEYNQTKATEKSSLLKVDLAEVARIEATKYEALLEKHLNEEKIRRATNYKIESQLVQWITKYDTDITQRQSELEELTETCDTSHTDLSALEEKFNEQIEVYHLYYEEWEENVSEVTYKAQQRAARIILRHLRRYHARKMLERKKNKKTKKGKSPDEVMKKKK